MTGSIAPSHFINPVLDHVFIGNLSVHVRHAAPFVLVDECLQKCALPIDEYTDTRLANSLRCSVLVLFR
jgi:hypothetical protein